MEGEATLCTSRKECNECDLTAALSSVSDWSIIMIDPRGLLLVVSHLFAVLVLVSWVGGGVAKKVNN